MFISVQTTLLFMLPQDQEAWQHFLRTNDLSEYKEDICSAWASYTKTDNYWSVPGVDEVKI